MDTDMFGNMTERNITMMYNITHGSGPLFGSRVTQHHNPYRQQEKQAMIELGFKTKKAYLKAMKKERKHQHEQQEQTENS